MNFFFFFYPNSIKYTLKANYINFLTCIWCKCYWPLGCTMQKCVWAQMDSKGPYQPAHLRSLISTFTDNHLLLQQAGMESKGPHDTLCIHRMVWICTVSHDTAHFYLRTISSDRVSCCAVLLLSSNDLETWKACLLSEGFVGELPSCILSSWAHQYCTA